MKKRALISVSDKNNLLDFVCALTELDYEIISTGGTRKVLEEAGIKTLAIDEVTQFPEMLDGRVKTLHPMIHGGLLGIRDKESHQQQMSKHGILPIDLVCVNLYPFRQTITKPGFTHEEAIENIDIGGPSMVRSAAKNHQFVTVVTQPEDYDLVLQEIRETGDTTLATRQALAAKAFRLTASYDAMISEYLTQVVQKEDPEKKTLTFDLKQTLRYGENPHQKATFYTSFHSYRYSISQAVQLHGKELSYNNIQDGSAALQILKEFSEGPAVVAVKHMNPCGIGLASHIDEAWDKAYQADPTSIFGGIVAFNEPVDLYCAQQMSQMFLEVILAPSFDLQAQEILSQKKNIRLLTFNKEGKDPVDKFVSVVGGLLVQQEDNISAIESELVVATTKAPSQEEIHDLLFGEKVVKHVKSNAIVIVKDGQTLGIGAGQMNRVGAAKIALEQAGEKARGAVMASDAFFPMDDTVEIASQYGITAIIQPGGSIKDQDSIDLCNKKNIAMVMTGKRHFKH